MDHATASFWLACQQDCVVAFSCKGRGFGGEAIRHSMHAWFATALAAEPAPWLLLRGSHATATRRSVRGAPRPVRRLGVVAALGLGRGVSPTGFSRNP